MFLEFQLGCSGNYGFIAKFFHVFRIDSTLENLLGDEKNKK